MISADAIISYTSAIAARFSPEKVILFGSYAYGEPNEDSDVDVLVVKRRPDRDADVKIRLGLGYAGFPMDLLVRSPAVIAQRIKWNDFLLIEVMSKGIILHASDDEGVGRMGRNRLRRRMRAAQAAKAVSV